MDNLITDKLRIERLETLIKAADNLFAYVQEAMEADLPNIEQWRVAAARVLPAKERS